MSWNLDFYPFSSSYSYFAKAITCLMAVTFIQISFHFTDRYYHLTNFIICQCHMTLHSQVGFNPSFNTWLTHSLTQMNLTSLMFDCNTVALIRTTTHLTQHFDFALDDLYLTITYSMELSSCPGIPTLYFSWYAFLWVPHRVYNLPSIM